MSTLMIREVTLGTGACRNGCFGSMFAKYNSVEHTQAARAHRDPLPQCTYVPPVSCLCWLQVAHRAGLFFEYQKDRSGEYALEHCLTWSLGLWCFRKPEAPVDITVEEVTLVLEEKTASFSLLGCNVRMSQRHFIGQGHSKTLRCSEPRVPMKGRTFPQTFM